MPPPTLTVFLSLCSLLWQNPVGAHDLEGSVFLMSRDGSSPKRISAEKPGWVTVSPRWAPAGRRILYVAQSGNRIEFHVVSATGEKLMRVKVPAHITSLAGVYWLPDGEAIALSRQDRGGIVRHLRRGAGGRRTEDQAGRVGPHSAGLGARREARRFHQFPRRQPRGVRCRYRGPQPAQPDPARGERRASDVVPGRPPHRLRERPLRNLEVCIAEAVSGEVINLSNHPAPGPGAVLVRRRQGNRLRFRPGLERPYLPHGG